MDWLERISITCFAASYLVVLGLEISRTIFRANWWKWTATSVSLAGLFAHAVYLTFHRELVIDNSGIFVGGWTGWFLGAALVLMIAYIWALFRQGDSVLGLFILPLVLICVAVGSWPSSSNAFSVSDTKTVWNTIHGLSLLLSTAIIGLGFLFGLMYLIQARRLKKNQILLVRMPSLEWLQKSGEKTLLVSASLLTIGLISGFAINIVNRMDGHTVIAWHDPVIWTSAILLVWLLFALAVTMYFRKGREGRKISYLVMFCFVFLLIEIGIVWYSGHLNRNPPIVEQADLPVVGEVQR